MAATLGFLADPHIGTTQHADHVRNCLDWMQAEASLLVGLCLPGDNEDSPRANFGSWVYDQGGLAHAIP